MSILFEAQENLPWYTQAMLGLADFVQQAQWLFVPFIALIVFVLLQAKELPKVKIALDRFAVSTPIINTFTKMLARIRYSSAMYLTVSAGVAIEQAMAQSAKVIGNGLLRQQLEAAQAKVRQGSSLADAFRQTIVYDDLHTGLIEVGEKSGDLESIFQEITEREQFDFENVVSRWTVLLEPILILLMAGLVGGVVVVMLMSIIAVQDISF
jgi:type II secretory pathway component PulF